MEWIAVGAEARGKGVGGTLLRWAEDFARSNGAERISLEVGTAVRAAW